MELITLEVAGLYPAIMGMRNPMKSRDLSDSTRNEHWVYVGKKDVTLCQKLIDGGAEHRKFLRQIQVWVDIDMPRYWWSEFDTYKIGTTSNSESTMHRLLNTKEPIALDMFMYCDEDLDILIPIIRRLEDLRIAYLRTKDVELLVRAKRLLPEGFLQLRTINMNYEVIRNIYHQRKNHRLKEEWVECFCSWAETLPYAEELILR